MSAIGVYFVALALIRLFLPAADAAFRIEDSWTFAMVTAVPLSATFFYFLAVFTFGLTGDVAAQQSMYPSRMFTLPVTTAALAGWPMLYGTAAMALLWFATRFVGVWPSGYRIPTIWPAVLAAVFVAWAQAVTWAPYPIRGLRVAVAVLLLTFIDAAVMLALQFEPPEWFMLVILAPNIPLAYLAARWAVDRARCGHVPDWHGLFARLGSIADILPRRREQFASAAQAQAWLEWRRHGRSLPLAVAILVPCELALLVLFRDTPVIVGEILADVLMTPPFMAAFAAATIRKSDPAAGDPYRLSPFLATRPLSSASLAAAKLRATIRSTIVSWLLVLIAIPVALRLSGTWSLVAERVHDVAGTAGVVRVVAVALLVLALLMIITWKQLVQTLYIGVSGREWAVKASVFTMLAFLAVIGPVVQWLLDHKGVIAAFLNALPSILSVLVCLKLSAAVWIAVRLLDRGLLSGRQVLIGAAWWDMAVFGLYGMLVWLLPSLLFRASVLVLVAILAIPLVRLSAVPLALASNRHQR